MHVRPAKGLHDASLISANEEHGSDISFLIRRVPEKKLSMEWADGWRTRGNSLDRSKTGLLLTLDVRCYLRLPPEIAAG